MQFRFIRNVSTIFLAVVIVGNTTATRAQQHTFKSGIDLVPLTVTVTDTSGKYVTGLTGSDFQVYEDGVEQPLAFFASDEVPIDVALVLDTSGSMVLDLPLVQSAATGLVRRLRAVDRAAVVDVKQSARIPQPFTSDRASVETAIHSLSASGETALYDGLYVALKEFQHERKAATDVRRQTLVLLSDGLDNNSHLAFDDVLDLARRIDVNIYVIALRSALADVPRRQQDGTILHADYVLNTLTRESGGRVFVPKSARDLSAIYTAIAQELSSQYELGYLPQRSAIEVGFRRVAVRVRPQTNALARTRSGYYATSRTRTGL
jgi:Ca-activated chloride channel family protein